jgi:tryptophan-rich sensory protein
MNHPLDEEQRPAGSLVPSAAVAMATLAFFVPYALSRSTTPTPDHPRIMSWYKGLRQPWFKPPDVVIPLAWSGIETGLAVSAYRLLRQPSAPHRDRALALLAANVVGIGSWSRLFFGARNLPASTAASAALGVAAAAYLNEVRKVDGPSTVASSPLLAWVCFATLLTGAIWRKNR